MEPNDLITKLPDIKEAGISVVNLNKNISKKMKKLAAITEFTERAVKKSLHDVITKMLGNQMLTLR